MRSLRLLPLAIVSAISLPAAAEGGCTSLSDNCAEVGKWQVSIGVGAGLRTNPVINRKDIPLVVLPEISYTGKRFFVQNLDIGWTLLESPRHSVNLLLTPGYDQIFFHRWNPGNFVVSTTYLVSPAPPDMSVRQDSVDQQPPPQIPGQDDNPPPGILGLKSAVADNTGVSYSAAITQETDASAERTATTLQLVDMSRLHKRRTAALAGLEYNLDMDDWSLQSQWLQDISNQHQGQEIRVSFTRYYRWQRHGLSLSLGANWQSREVVDYYYGIRPDEVSNEQSVYIGKAGVSGLASLEWRYALSENWTLRFHTSYRQLAKEIRNSPLINEDQVITSFIGGVYHF